MGYAPYRGTGWAVPNAPPPQQYQNRPYYASNYNQVSDDAPHKTLDVCVCVRSQVVLTHSAIQAPPTYAQNQEYYGGQQPNDVELQQPQSSYQGVYQQPGGYAPPPGAPPGKGDGIIR